MTEEEALVAFVTNVGRRRKTSTPDKDIRRPSVMNRESLHAAKTIHDCEREILIAVEGGLGAGPGDVGSLMRWVIWPRHLVD